MFLCRYFFEVLILSMFTLREKCPNTALFLVRIFLYSDFSVFRPNTGKYRPEITPHLDTFQVVLVITVGNIKKKLPKKGNQPKGKKNWTISFLIDSKTSTWGWSINFNNLLLRVILMAFLFMSLSKEFQVSLV